MQASRWVSCPLALSCSTTSTFYTLFSLISSTLAKLKYVTSEAASKLDGELVIENIHHHAQTKAKLKPHLEYLDKQLRLEPHKNLTDSEQFAANYVSSIRKLPTAAQIRYISENI